MNNLINLQETAATLYNTVLDMNKSITAMVGLDAIWCRLLPYDNGEDVIVQEYTLHQYECPKNIKVVSNNANYNVGNFAIDLFGIKNAETLEIHIDVDTWKAVYGEDSIPQKGDFVLIPIMHRPYEVVSSTAVHTIGQKITHWKCVLGEWKHTASRKETEDFHISIDELTNSQDRLFGDTISKEVADAVNEVETAYNTTTYVDPFKDFDMNDIIVDTILGKEKAVVAEAYYSFKSATRPVKYKNLENTIYDINAKENKWIFTCWFRSEYTNDNSYKAKISLYSKDANYWYFNIIPDTALAYGEKISLFRGTTINLNGIVDNDECVKGWIIKVSTSECLKYNKKYPKFWETGIWKIKTKKYYNLFTTYDSNEKTNLKIDITSDNYLQFKCNDIEKDIFIKKLKLNEWNYLALEISPNHLRTVIMNTFVDPLGNVQDELVIDENTDINIKTFAFDSAAITNIKQDFNLANIRLFENEYEMKDTYKKDMYSQVTRNASKLILVDGPKAPNNMSFKSQIR